MRPKDDWQADNNGDLIPLFYCFYFLERAIPDIADAFLNYPLNASASMRFDQ
jgi:hypothetical protein